MDVPYPARLNTARGVRPRPWVGRPLAPGIPFPGLMGSSTKAQRHRRRLILSARNRAIPGPNAPRAPEYPEAHSRPFSGDLTRFPGTCNRGRPWAGLDHSAKGEPRSFPTQHAHQTEAPNPRRPDLWDSIHQRQGTGTVLQGHVPKVILNKLARKIGIKNIFRAKPLREGFAPKPRFRLILTKSCTKIQGWLTNRSDA